MCKNLIFLIGHLNNCATFEDQKRQNSKTRQGLSCIEWRTRGPVLNNYTCLLRYHEAQFWFITCLAVPVPLFPATVRYFRCKLRVYVTGSSELVSVYQNNTQALFHSQTQTVITVDLEVCCVKSFVFISKSSFLCCYSIAVVPLYPC